MELCTEKEAISGKPYYTICLQTAATPLSYLLFQFHIPLASPPPATAVELIERALLAQTQASYTDLNGLHCQAEVAICLHAFSPLQL